MSRLTLSRILDRHSIPNHFASGRVMADPLDGGGVWVDVTDYTAGELLGWLGY